jgi:hypothetical protein
VRLQEDGFLNGVADAYLEQQSQEMPIGVPDATAIQSQIEKFTAKRGRILEAFFDGTVDRRQRDEELARVDAELNAYQGIVATRTISRPSVSAADLANVFSVFVEMPFLQRDDKRSLLRGLGVGVFVSGYEILALTMRNLAGLDCNTDNRSKMGQFASHVRPCL